MRHRCIDVEIAAAVENESAVTLKPHDLVPVPMRKVRGPARQREIRSSASPRETALVLNRPRTADVVVVAPGLRIPRIAIHRCSASITTITRAG